LLSCRLYSQHLEADDGSQFPGPLGTTSELSAALLVAIKLKTLLASITRNSAMVEYFPSGVFIIRPVFGFGALCEAQYEIIMVFWLPFLPL
jgi:hypothetical protein